MSIKYKSNGMFTDLNGVIVKSETTSIPADMEIYGIVNDSLGIWSLMNETYVMRGEDIFGTKDTKGCILACMTVVIPKGCTASLAWDKMGLLINAYHVERSGDYIGSSSFQAQPYTINNSNGVDDCIVIVEGCKSDRTAFTRDELPTKLNVTFNR